MGSPAQPLINARDKIIDWANKLEEWDKPAPKKGPPPLAKDLRWADQSEMRKPVGKKAAASRAAIKKAPARRTQRKRAQ